MSEEVLPDRATTTDAASPRPRTRRLGTQAERYGVVVAWLLVIVVFSLLLPDTFATLGTARLILGTQTVILVATLGLMLSLAVGEYDLSIGSVVFEDLAHLCTRVHVLRDGLITATLERREVSAHAVAAAVHAAVEPSG